MGSAILYSLFGAFAGAVGAYYVCAVFRFKRVERKCIKSCLPLMLYAALIFFLVCSFAQLLYLLPDGVEGILSLSLLVCVAIWSYRKTLLQKLPRLFEDQEQPELLMLEHRRLLQHKERTNLGGK